MKNSVALLFCIFLSVGVHATPPTLAELLEQQAALDHDLGLMEGIQRTYTVLLENRHPRLLFNGVTNGDSFRDPDIREALSEIQDKNDRLFRQLERPGFREYGLDPEKCALQLTEVQALPAVRRARDLLEQKRVAQHRRIVEFIRWANKNDPNFTTSELKKVLDEMVGSCDRLRERLVFMTVRNQEAAERASQLEARCAAAEKKLKDLQAGYQASHAAYVASKLERLVEEERLENILGQTLERLIESRRPQVVDDQYEFFGFEIWHESHRILLIEQLRTLITYQVQVAMLRRLAGDRLHFEVKVEKSGFFNTHLALQMWIRAKGLKAPWNRSFVVRDFLELKEQLRVLLEAELPKIKTIVHDYCDIERALRERAETELRTQAATLAYPSSAEAAAMPEEPAEGSTSSLYPALPSSLQLPPNFPSRVHEVD